MTEQKKINYEELKKGGIIKLKNNDMFSIWVKTSCCNLNSDQLRKLADISEKYARGYLLFTTRQTPHIPFVSLNDVENVKKELAEVYLELDRCGARVRNINVCYDNKICPDAVTNSITLAEKLDNFFYDPVPYKIKIGVVGCRRDCIVTRILTDIGFVGVSYNGRTGYEVYVGSRLGLNPYTGARMADFLTEEESVRFTQNCFELFKEEGKAGERMADILIRLGTDKVKSRLTAGLKEFSLIKPIKCQTKLKETITDKTIIKILATCGEVTADQARNIAGVADDYGIGIVHFPVRGYPEIPGINKNLESEIRKKLRETGLQIHDRNIDNLQTCYGSYCTESNMDTQTLLKEIEKKISRFNLDGLDIKISASGCPNSCGIPQLSDIGFVGIIEPEIETGLCSGCGLCKTICKRKAVNLMNEKAFIDKKICGFCGQCLAVCPKNALYEKRRGIALMAGGREGIEPRLGETVAEFLTVNEAVTAAERCLELAEKNKSGLAEIIEEIGIDNFKGLLSLEKEKES